MQNLEMLLIALPVLILSVVLHEYAHGWAAFRQGDQTAAMLGRLTLNPIAHIDPIGSILVPAVLAVAGAPVLGWAKPVPVNPRNFRNFKRGDIIVSLAGVTANLMLVVAFLLLWVVIAWLYRFLPAIEPTWQLLGLMAAYGIQINLILILFNLLPIPPLDGSHVFYHLLPPHLGARYREIGKYGMLILFGLLFLTGFRFLTWPVEWLFGLAMSLGGLLIF